jgi:hypothetical protein
VIAQVDELRKNVNLADTLRSIESWTDADASQSQPHKASHHARHIAKGSTHVAKYGEHVRARKEGSLSESHSPQVSPPLQRSSAAFDRTHPAPNIRADNDDDFTGTDATLPKASSSVRAFNKMHAATKKNEHMVNRKESAAEQQRTNGRRRLRAKIVNVIMEVRRRQFLREQQEKAKQFRDERFSRGVGVQPSLGDTTDEAFGLCSLREDDEALPSQIKAAIYMRSALLDALSLEELVMVRSAPDWFFSGSALAAAVPPQPVSSQHEGTPSYGTLQSTGKSSTLSGSGAVSISNPCDFEDLIDFFSVSETDRNMDARVYARKLRAQIRDVDGRQRFPGMSEVVDLRKTLCRSPESSSEQAPLEVDGSPAGPLEMMPCLGRRPQIRCDEESPTLTKVREVCKRKNEQDERWVDERREAISRRIALNSFKAKEQQREFLLEIFKQKELHKLRMYSAEERKSILNAEEEELAEQQSISRIQKVYYAVERSEKATEDKRDQVSLSLEEWRARVAGANHNMRKMEVVKTREAQRAQQKYMERLNAIGERRQITVVSQSRKNDELKKRIQTSLVQQLAEQRQQEKSACAEALQAKHEAAEFRRLRHKLGHRYGFSERAFGESAMDFDAKHHMVAVDRRGESWRRTADDWDKLKASFSVPELGALRPLSPGGGLSEIASSMPASLEKSVSAPRYLG